MASKRNWEEVEFIDFGQHKKIFMICDLDRYRYCDHNIFLVSRSGSRSRFSEFIGIVIAITKNRDRCPACFQIRVCKS